MPALPEGTILTSLAEALATGHPGVADLLRERVTVDDGAFKALNDSWLEDGYVLIVPEDVTVDLPIEILSVGTGGALPPAYQPRNLIIAGARSRVTVVEHHVGLCIGGYFANVVTDVAAGPEAIVRHCKVQDESKEAIHVALLDATLGRDAMFDSFCFTLGGRISRNELRVSLDGPGAHCRLNAPISSAGISIDDHTDRRHHAARRTHSDHLQGRAGRRARAVVHRAGLGPAGRAQVEAHQMSRALCL